MFKNLIRFSKRLVGVYEPGHEYWVKLSDIHITPQFARAMVGKAKYKKKWQFYHRNGYCESKIVLDKNFTLLDGYSSFLIYKAAEGSDAKVPVWFAD